MNVLLSRVAAHSYAPFPTSDMSETITRIYTTMSTSLRMHWLIENAFRVGTHIVTSLQMRGAACDRLSSSSDLSGVFSVELKRMTGGNLAVVYSRHGLITVS